MEFDKSRIYTALNADGIRIGSTGYFANTISDLQSVVDEEDPGYYGEIEYIRGTDYEHRFVTNPDFEYSFFYLVKEPKPIT